MFSENGYDPTDKFALQALNDAMAAGYIYPNRLGGVMITVKGFQERGNW